MAKSPQAKSLLSFAVPERQQLSAYCKKAHNQSQLADIAALRNILGLGVGAFGAGALLRSAKEVPTVLGATPNNQVTTGAVGQVEVPIPMDPEEEQKRLAMQPKFAETDMLGSAAKGLYDNVLQPMGLDKADTWQTTTPTAKWWHAPAMLGAGAATGTGGWKLVDWLADRRRSQAGDTELQNAQQEYESAVKGLHAKTAALDDARATLKKQALEGVQPDALLRSPLAPNATKNFAGLGANALFGIAALTGIPTAAFAYTHARNTNDVKALQEALIARRRAQQIRNPAPPHLVLAPSAG